MNWCFFSSLGIRGLFVVGLILNSLLLSAQPYIAKPQIINPGKGNPTVSGKVFHDVNRNGLLDKDEHGVPNVLVSNGKDWTQTDEDGGYTMAVRPDMNLTIVQPAGWRLPTNEQFVPQFFYIHKETGTPYELQFGGLKATGPAPEKIHFPLSREGAAGKDFSCAVLGDPQTYTNQQLSWLRNGVLADVLEMNYQTGDFMLQLGDVVGDDLSLIPRSLELAATTQLPQWLVIGNHDVDLDARSNAEKADTWRAKVGPNYYAFEAGQTVFITLDNIFYPCTQEDAERGVTRCAEGNTPTYNGRLDEVQWEWLEGLLARTPKDKLVVIATHIPLVSSIDGGNRQHQLDELPRLYQLLKGREVLSLSGHTHTTENHAPGQTFAGWSESMGIGPLPFRHIIAGAASGAWYQGDFTHFGVPMSLQRMGTPMGYFHVEFSENLYRERYIGARLGKDKGQWVSLNTPEFRRWYNAIVEWKNLPASERPELPPFSINDLADNQLLVPNDFDEGVWVTANVWAGDAETRVELVLSDGRSFEMERTQQGAGESLHQGAQWVDPFAAMRQLSVARYAYQSSQGAEKAQGIELFRGNNPGPLAPQPQSTVTDRNMHLWQFQLPELPLGVHALEVISRNRFGLEYRDKLVVEVRRERLSPYWNGE